MNQAQRRRLPALADVKRLYVTEQLSSTAIAARYGCHAQSIRHMLKREGITIRNKREAALAGPSEWTDERKKRLKELWFTDMGVEQIRQELGITYTNRSVSRQAAVLGLPPRCEQPKRKVMTPKAIEWRRRQEDREKYQLPTREQSEQALLRTLVSFEPHRRLQTLWLTALAEVRSERAAAWRTICGVTR